MLVRSGVDDKEDGPDLPSLVEGRDLMTEVPREARDAILGGDVLIM